MKEQLKTIKKKNIIRTTGADAIMRSLIGEGVDTVFGYPGGAIMPIYDALMDHNDKIRHILTRHEQGAMHAAQGYARVTGKVGVVMATSGPGATNLITGIADAMIDSTPLVCITGQVASSLLGTDAFQETDVIGISMPVTKWNYLITKQEEIPEIMAQAFYIARSGRPGPVLIDIAKNAQFGELNFEYKKCIKLRSYVPKLKPDKEKIKEAAVLINNAKKPYVLFGQGVILGAAEDEFRAFIEKSGIPAAWTILGACALPKQHPLNVGMLGMHGNYSANIKTNECDLLIAVGMRFDDRVTGDLKRYAKQARVIHLEIDPAEINKNVRADVAVIGDVKETLPILTGMIEKRSHTSWIREFRDADKIEYKTVISKDLYPKKEGLTMGEVIRILNEKTRGNAIVVTDVGQHQMITSRYFNFTNKRAFVTSGGLGTMGFGLPAAHGAKIGAPEKEVVLIVGDGGLQMTIQELGTINQTQAAVKIVLMNNKYLGMVRQWQQLFFDKRYSETYLLNPDFIKVAEGFGIKGKKVIYRPELENAIQEMLDFTGPYFLEVNIEKEDNVFPMVTTGASVSEVILEPKK
ncbi:MAG: biosynthetic-type acetolactate synthase large subunit [Bacteroidales bacterium]|nr:biosynthetic-type acetolactate synthase large subunit [Bacteroidales bacterium]MBN2764612.1 biosynthetic-type acetolactate synthase large subunit [Bacteroidales bacterium]